MGSNQNEATEDGWLPVIQLFNGKIRQSALEYAITRYHGDGFQQADLARVIDASETSIQTNVEMLEEMGIIEVVNEGKNIPKYALTDGDPVRVLRQWGIAPPLRLLKEPGGRHLVEFFLDTAEPETAYSKNAIGTHGGPGYDAVTNNIDRLVREGLVIKVDGKQNPDYVLNTESVAYEYLARLNEAVFEAREQMES